MKEREIGLLDLIVELLLSWRLIVTWMLVGAILMGGFSYVNSIRLAAAQRALLEQQKIEREEQQTLWEEQMKDEEATTEELTKKLTESQKNTVQNVVQHETMRTFYKDSVYLQMDAAKVPMTELSYLIKSSVLEESYSIERLYEDILESGLQQWLVEQGYEVVFGDIRELVVLERGTGTVETDSFCVQIIHVTEEQCRELAGLVKEYIEVQQTNIAHQVGEHDLVLVNQTFAFVRDANVLNQQKTLWSNITNINVAVDKALADFSEEENAYYEFLMHVPAEEADVEQDKNLGEVVLVTPGISTKYVVLGMILFALIYVFYVFLKFIMNNRLRFNDDICALYNVPQLGRIPVGVHRKKLFGFVDQLLLKLRDCNNRIFTNEEALGLAGVAVKMAAKKEAFETVGCIGCDMKENTLKVAESIQKVLEEDSIEMTVLNNVLYDQGAMEQLQGVKSVFLLEKSGETLYNEITKELELLNRQEIKILGVVVVE